MVRAVDERTGGPAEEGAGGGLTAGCPVEVRTRFDGRWVGGFRVVSREAGGFRLARSCDGSDLPELLGAHEVRPLAGAGPGTWSRSA